MIRAALSPIRRYPAFLPTPRQAFYGDTFRVGGAKSGNAAQFTALNAEYFSITDNPSLSGGDIDLTWGGWFFFDSFPASYLGLITKWSGSVASAEYALYARTNAGSTQFLNVVGDGTGIPSDNVADVALSTGTWYFVVADHNSVTNTIGISVNNGTRYTTPWTTGILDGVNPFFIGRDQSATYFDGRAQCLFVTKEILTAANLTALYNNGVPLRYADAAQYFAQLKGYWNLGEESGPREDASGNGNTLTDNSTVTQNNGAVLWEARNDEQIRQLTDLSGNGWHASQSGNVTTKPTYRIGISNSRPGVRYDGTDDCLLFENEAGAFSTSNFSFFMVFIRRTDTGASEILFDNRDGAVDGFSIQIDANDKLRTIYNAIIVTSTVSIATSAPYIVAIIADGSNITQYIKGVQDGQEAQSGLISEATDAKIGARSFTSALSFAPADICEIILYGRAVAVGEHKRVNRYLGRKYWIAITG